MEKQELVQVHSSPAEMIMAAVTANTDLDKLKGLMELQERWEKNEARKSFAKDFASAQAEIEPAVRKFRNKQTNSSYADLAGVIETAQPVYSKYGFAVKFNEGDCPKEGHVRVLADVSHKNGHTENYHFDVPLDGKGIRGNENMTAIHGKASSVTYGRRYLMCMIWNIPTQDVDGNAAVSDPVTDKQLHTLRDLLISKELTEAKLIGFLKIDTLEELPAKRYMEALQAINSAVKKTVSEANK